MDLNLIKFELFISLFIGAFIFFLISQSSKKNILSLIFISIFGYFIYLYLFDINNKKQKSNLSNETFFNNEIINRHEIFNDNYFLNKFPKKGLKFFLKNKELVDIAKNVVITRMFDKSKYADLLFLMNEYYKVYTYILADRYDPNTYITIFIDLGNSILELLYSIYFVVPETLRHVYGLNTYDTLEQNISSFTLLHKNLLNILKSYITKQKNIPYFPDIDITPANQHSQNMLP